jgi:hypothetical protein
MGRLDVAGANAMISVHLRAERRPRVVGVFSFRYDAHLVPALIANIEPFVDGWIAYDDRGATDIFSNETQRRTALLHAAREAGAAWALAVDPDERFEAALADKMVTLLDHAEARAHTFPVREMYAPDRYRIDGVWGVKRQARLLSLSEGVVTPPGDLHLPWSTLIPNAHLHHTEINLYHLKMITAERREARAALYNHLDPNRVMQSIGYDYLADNTGAEFETMAADRAYFPPHQDDGGLWMARVGPEC